jgi:hypothetical protein
MSKERALDAFVLAFRPPQHLLCIAWATSIAAEERRRHGRASQLNE